MKIMVICKFILFVHLPTIALVQKCYIQLALHLPCQQCQWQHLHDSGGNPQHQHCHSMLPGVVVFSDTIYQRMKQEQIKL